MLFVITRDDNIKLYFIKYHTGPGNDFLRTEVVGDIPPESVGRGWKIKQRPRSSRNNSPAQVWYLIFIIPYGVTVNDAKMSQSKPYFSLVVSVTENRSTDTKPNTNQNQGKIPKPNQLKNMREIPTFYRIFSLFYIRYD